MGNITQSMIAVQAVSQIELNANEPLSYVGLCENKDFKELEMHIERSMEQSQQRCYGVILKAFMKRLESPHKLVCNVSNDQYAVEAYIPEKGEYVCIDAVGGLVFTPTSVGVGLECNRSEK
jgi:hypothetical protein